MRAREYLQEYRSRVKQIRLLKAQIAEQKSMAESLSSWTDGDRVQSTKDPDRIGKAVAKIADMEAECDDLIIESIDRMEEIQARVRTIRDPDVALVLDYRYIKGLQWETIAGRMFCTTRWARELRDRGCRELDRRYGDGK